MFDIVLYIVSGIVCILSFVIYFWSFKNILKNNISKKIYVASYIKIIVCAIFAIIYFVKDNNLAGLGFIFLMGSGIVTIKNIRINEKKKNKVMDFYNQK